MRHRVGGLVLAAALAPPCAWAEPAPPLPGRDRALADFAVRISSVVGRKDTDHILFHGCVDWHSAVHGHWALLRISRVLRDPEIGRAADRRLNPEDLSRERLYMKERGHFEMPYGRAWFLRLALEHEAWSRENGAPDPERLRPMADEIADSILAYYEEFPPTPFSHNYLNASWALVHLRDYCRRFSRAACLASVAQRLEPAFAGPARLTFAADFGSPEFFSPFGNWAYLVARSGDKAALKRFLSRADLSDAALRPITRLVPYPHDPAVRARDFPHHLGANWSRAWALRRLAIESRGARRDRLVAAYASHVAEALKVDARSGDDYRAYGHWVPQFAVFALTEGDAD